MLARWEAPDRGALFVVSGASGAGKSTLLKRLFETVPGLEFSVSATTRAPRPGERDGVEYHFVDLPTFREMVARGELYEWAEVYGRCYGTPRGPVDAALSEGRSIVLDIDVQGAAQVRRVCPDAVTVFILPPSLEALHERLVGRGTDAPEVVQRRMADAAQQLQACGDYGYLVLNDDLETATTQLVGVFVAELSRRGRRDAWVRRFARS